MGITDFIKGQFVDVIEYVDESNKMIVHKYTRYGNEIKQGASLIVRNGQEAVFVNQGTVADILKPGKYSLDTNNLPVLSSLKAIPRLLNSPLKSDLYFINMTNFIGNRWGTKNPILFRDKDLKFIRVTAFGTFSFCISDTLTFMTEIFGARKLDMTYDIIEFICSFISESVAETIGNLDVSVMDLAANYRNLSDGIRQNVNEKAKKFGIEVSEMVIENISLPREVEKLIDEQSGIGMASGDMDTFMQYQTARAMRDAAKQDGGLAGLGAGFAFGNQIAGSVQNNAQSDVDKVQKLREYKTLLDEGIISEEEFQELKKKILKI